MSAHILIVQDRVDDDVWHLFYGNDKYGEIQAWCGRRPGFLGGEEITERSSPLPTGFYGVVHYRRFPELRQVLEMDYDKEVTCPDCRKHLSKNQF